jgi:hypothetical protein
MSALGQKQTFAVQNDMSALPPKADMCSAVGYVRFGPKADTGLKTERPPCGGLSEIQSVVLIRRQLGLIRSISKGGRFAALFGGGRGRRVRPDHRTGCAKRKTG